MSQIAISYGPTHAPIEEQLKQQGYEIPNVDRYEQSRIALLHLSMVGVLTDAMTEKGFGRLHNEIMKRSTRIATEPKSNG